MATEMWDFYIPMDADALATDRREFQQRGCLQLPSMNVVESDTFFEFGQTRETRSGTEDCSDLENDGTTSNCFSAPPSAAELENSSFMVQNFDDVFEFQIGSGFCDPLPGDEEIELGRDESEETLMIRESITYVDEARSVSVKPQKEKRQTENGLDSQCAGSPKQQAFPAEEEDVSVQEAPMVVNHRGWNTKWNPHAQEIARQGQKHWNAQVRALRRAWEASAVRRENADYVEQLGMCHRANTKNQHECLLRTLQMAADDGVVVPIGFSSDPAISFHGWLGFHVSPGSSLEFERRIGCMFPPPLRKKTFQLIFRRAGLLPASSGVKCWNTALLGSVPFVFNSAKREAYRPP
eukprot:CAMPEP_0181307384 /NCGR_PEP_ID=MMETSP1101-20121128/10849_1 /TAXON_ID=46948 /ORGANISM="Rhodomonas abbreviata, Strain Caron Lab Isolate" /LENGTH=350 /DNA_ID=CAMNT_0023413593 /DNA_START=225 /DNA_END=1277 /DNA_ORIENTATION=+